MSEMVRAAQAEFGQPAAIVASPAAMLQLAIEKGTEPATLKSLTDLYERWQANAARQTFNVAMNACQDRMPKVVKDRENSHTRSRYAALETVQSAIKDTYIKHGFSITFAEDKAEREGWIRVVGTVRHVGGHTETFYREGPVDNIGSGGKATKTELHGVASTVTYLTRHLLCGIFSVTVANHDDDGNQGRQGGTVTQEQAATLRAMIDECENRNKPFDLAKFRKTYGIASLEELPASEYDEVLALFRRKLGDA